MVKDFKDDPNLLDLNSFVSNNNSFESKKKLSKTDRDVKKRKKNYQKRNSSVFDLNNFIVQNNSFKNIQPKNDFVNIPIPIFKELEDEFYEEDESNEDKFRQFQNTEGYVILYFNANRNHHMMRITYHSTIDYMRSRKLNIELIFIKKRSKRLDSKVMN